MKGPIEVSDVVIRGAGMWYSTLVGVDDYTPDNRVAIYGNGSNVSLADFAILGKLNYRNDSEANDGIGGSFGTGSSIRNIWVEHTKTGAWLVNSDGLVVEGCRFRDTIADGINLCVGMRNTTRPQLHGARHRRRLLCHLARIVREVNLRGWAQSLRELHRPTPISRPGLFDLRR